MKKEKTYVYDLRTERGSRLGRIILSDGFYMSVTDYGNFGYYWNAIGDMDFRQFILTLDSDYFCQKMKNGVSYISSSQTTKRIVLQYTKYILPALKEAIKKEIELEETEETK